jgi:hypothetical protein
VALGAGWRRGLVVGAVLIVALAANSHWSGVILFPPVILASIVLHEGGHAAAAKLVGWRVLLICVQPLVLRLGPIGLHFAPRGATATIGADTLGYVIAVPWSAGANQRWRAIATTAGGPLASGLGMALGMGGMAAVQGPILQSCAAVFVLANVFCLVGTLLPFKTAKGTCSDGRLMIDWLSSPSPPSPALWLGSLLAAHMRPRRWPAWIVEDVSASSPGSFAAFYRALDAEDPRPAEIRLALDRLTAEHPPGAWSAFEAFVSAHYENKPERARALLEGLGEASAKDPNALMARAALAAACGDHAGMEEHLLSLRRALRGMLPWGSYEDAMAAIRARCKAARPVVVDP